jgi:hypothetical protein
MWEPKFPKVARGGASYHSRPFFLVSLWVTCGEAGTLGRFLSSMAAEMLGFIFK